MYNGLECQLVLVEAGCLSYAFSEGFLIYIYVHMLLLETVFYKHAVTFKNFQLAFTQLVIVQFHVY